MNSIGHITSWTQTTNSETPSTRTHFRLRRQKESNTEFNLLKTFQEETENAILLAEISKINLILWRILSVQMLTSLSSQSLFQILNQISNKLTRTSTMRALRCRQWKWWKTIRSTDGFILITRTSTTSWQLRPSWNQRLSPAKYYNTMANSNQHWIPIS